MSLIHCEINLIPTWCANYFIIDGLVNNQVSKIVITDTIQCPGCNFINSLQCKTITTV